MDLSTANNNYPAVGKFTIRPVLDATNLNNFANEIKSKSLHEYSYKLDR